MSHETFIEQTFKSLSKLPNNKVREVSDFTDFIMKKYEQETLQKGIQMLTTHYKSFDFLNDEEELYTLDGLKEKYQMKKGDIINLFAFNRPSIRNQKTTAATSPI